MEEQYSEKRISKVIISRAGGTAGKNSNTYKVALPSAWINKMGIDVENNSIELSFDGEQIVIKKRLSLDDFMSHKINKGHDVKMISYYDGDMLCTRICADFTDYSIAIENEEVSNVNRAFGANDAPTWDDFMAFLEDRCVPRQRDGIKYYLNELGLDEYDPFEIVKITGGKMSEDNQWLQIDDLSSI